MNSTSGTKASMPRSAVFATGTAAVDDGAWKQFETTPLATTPSAPPGLGKPIPKLPPANATMSYDPVEIGGEAGGISKQLRRLKVKQQAHTAHGDQLSG